MNTEQMLKMYDSDARENAVKDFVKHHVEQWMDMGLFRSCINCAHWNDEHAVTRPPETCSKHNNARPPARIIVTGCPDHTDNIPF